MCEKRHWLIQLRKAKNMSRLEVANKVDITETAYFYIENNQRNPSVRLAQKIAKELGFNWILFYPTKNQEM